MTTHLESSTNSEPTTAHEPIVVGVDGSDCSRRALQWAADQATLTGRELVAVTSWQVPNTYGYPVPWPANVSFEDDARQSLEESIEKALGANPSPTPTLVVVEGHPAPTLVEQSKQAALIVVGSRGHGEFAGMLLGSVGEYLTTHAHCPVVIVRGHR
jgi:nucleotide-binding universal stress UspA family protein